MPTKDDILSGFNKSLYGEQEQENNPVIPAIDSSLAGAPGNGGKTVAPGASVQNTTTTTTPGVTPQEKAPATYEEMFKAMNPFKPKTAEEIEAERKKERRDKTFAAIGDGISALSNLLFTTQGAPNSYDPKQSMSGKTEARWDKLHAEYDKNRDAYVNGMLRARQMDENAANQKITMQLRQEAEQRKKEAQDKKNQYTDAQIDVMIKRGDTEALKAEYQRLKNDLLSETEPLQIEKLQKQIQKIENDMRNSNARTLHYINGGNGGSGGGGKTDTYVMGDDAYEIPKQFISNNRAQLMNAAGVSATEEYDDFGTIKKRNKSNNDIDSEIRKKYASDPEVRERIAAIMNRGGKQKKSSGSQGGGTKPAGKGKGYGSSSSGSGNTKGKGKGY